MVMGGAKPTPINHQRSARCAPRWQVLIAALLLATAGCSDGRVAQDSAMRAAQRGYATPEVRHHIGRTRR